MASDVAHIRNTEWDNARTVSDGSVNTSNEQLTLMGFAQRLGCTLLNNEPSIADENDVRKEAILLMSLSSTPPGCIDEESGRITPQSDVSSCHSSSTRRGSFSFSCPSLSLENHHHHPRALADTDAADPQNSKSAPSVLLSRVLTIEDRDALRLSSEAMARNIMQSYQKAIEWRIESWSTSISKILVKKEKSLREAAASQEAIQGLVRSGEAKLLMKLRQASKGVRVHGASTSFNVLPQKAPRSERDGPQKHRQPTDDDDDAMVGLEETEYQYHVDHLLMLQAELNVCAPGIGNTQIDLQVPGTMKGTFLSIEPGNDHLVNVEIEVDTQILAAMIEKSSRLVVRSATEALLKDDKPAPPQNTGTAPPVAELKLGERVSTPSNPPAPTFTPQRDFSRELNDRGLVIVTPRDTASPSSFGDSDNEDKPVLLPIPDSFGDEQVKSGIRMITPHPTRPRNTSSIAFASRLPPKKKARLMPPVVSPHKTSRLASKPSGKGPNLPVLVKVACAVMRSN